MAQPSVQGKLLLSQPGLFPQRTQAMAGTAFVRSPAGNDVPDVSRLLSRQDGFDRVGSVEKASALPAHDGLHTDSSKLGGLLACKPTHGHRLAQQHHLNIAHGDVVVCDMMASTMQDAARTPPDAIALNLQDAAVRLGISPDAARKRLERGTLRGVKNHGRWVVYLEPDAAVSEVDAASDTTPDADRTPLSNMLDAAPDVPGRQWTPSDAASGGTQQDDHPGIVPLVELVTELTRRNDELARQNIEVATAAAIWQERARFLSERLAALEAGTIVPATTDSETSISAHAPHDAPEGPGRVDPHEMTADTSQGTRTAPSAGSVSLWQKLRRAITGN